MVTLLLGAIVVAIGAIYVVYAFVAPLPWLRIVMRCLPVVPVAIWTIWVDRSRPLQSQPPLVRNGGRILLFALVMSFAVALLGFALNWLDDPGRVV